MNNESNESTAGRLVVKVDTSALTATLALLEQIKAAAQEAAAAVATLPTAFGGITLVGVSGPELELHDAPRR